MTNTRVTAVVHIETPVHGRVLVRPPQHAGPWPAIVGFHGYAENAETHLRALEGIPGAEAWLLVAVQALHPFYTRQQKVVANWMTSEDREIAIADNLAYVARALAGVREEYGFLPTTVFAGFSQGGAMAYRAATQHDCAGLLILAADVPPDVVAQRGAQLPPILIGRGTRDEWYTEQKHAADLAALAALGADVESCVFDGGHEWSPEFYAAAARFLSTTKITKNTKNTKTV